MFRCLAVLAAIFAALALGSAAHAQVRVTTCGSPTFQSVSPVEQTIDTHGQLCTGGGWSSANIATNTTTPIKSGAGVLHSVCVNTKGASANTATIYDNTAGSGTKLATIDTTAAVGCLSGYDAAFTTGLTVVTATGTPGDITVSYR